MQKLKKKKKNKSHKKKLYKKLTNQKEKQNVFLLKNIPIPWLLSNPMVDTTMILLIWPVLNIDLLLSIPTESFTSLMLDKENISKWSLRQQEKPDGLQIKDVNIWDSVLSWDKMEKNSLPEKV